MPTNSQGKGVPVSTCLTNNQEDQPNINVETLSLVPDMAELNRDPEDQGSTGLISIKVEVEPDSNGILHVCDNKTQNCTMSENQSDGREQDLDALEVKDNNWIT